MCFLEASLVWLRRSRNSSPTHCPWVSRPSLSQSPLPLQRRGGADSGAEELLGLRRARLFLGFFPMWAHACLSVTGLVRAEQKSVFASPSRHPTNEKQAQERCAIECASVEVVRWPCSPQGQCKLTFTRGLSLLCLGPRCSQPA